MLLTPTELERLTIFTAAELARRRKSRGLKLNHPEGVADMMPVIQVEATFPDGTKLVTVHDPIRPGKRKVPADQRVRPGEVIAAEGEIEINAGRRRATIKAVNTGDRPHR